jgi:peptidoglycan/LPS O-acetylase OafA/YrhL
LVKLFTKNSNVSFFLGLLYKFNDQLKSKFLNYAAEVSFGVFFLHSYFISGIKLLYKTIFYELPTASVFSYFLFSIAIFMSCLLLIFLIKKITEKYSKFIIGC